MLEVPRGGLERLLEALADLAVGVGDQLVQLAQRGLEIVALALELLDVRERLLVFGLGERVDRAELLAAAAQPLEPAASAPRAPPRRAPRRRGRLRARAAPRAAEAPRVDSSAPVPGPLQADLASVSALVALAQPRVQHRLLLSALLQLRRHVLAGLAVGAERELELLAGARRSPPRRRSSATITARDARQQRLVARDRLAQALDPRPRALPARARRARARRARPPARPAAAAGGPRRGRRREPPAGARSPPRAGAPPRPPRRAALTAARWAAIACSRSRLDLASTGRRAALDRAARAELGLRRRLARPDELLAAVALGEHALLADRRGLAELPGARPTRPGRRG